MLVATLIWRGARDAAEFWLLLVGEAPPPVLELAADAWTAETMAEAACWRLFMAELMVLVSSGLPEVV